MAFINLITPRFSIRLIEKSQVNFKCNNKTRQFSNLKNLNASGSVSDSLNDADIEARKIRDEADRRKAEEERARAQKQLKIDRLNAIPETAEAGTVEEFMYKDGVKDILEKLDNDLVGLKPVKNRVR